MRHPKVDEAEAMIEEIGAKLEELGDLVAELRKYASDKQVHDYCYTDFECDVNRAISAFQMINAMSISEIHWKKYAPVDTNIA